MDDIKDFTERYQRDRVEVVANSIYVDMMQRAQSGHTSCTRRSDLMNLSNEQMEKLKNKFKDEGYTIEEYKSKTDTPFLKVSWKYK
jgi:hypothetical protein